MVNVNSLLGVVRKIARINNSPEKGGDKVGDLVKMMLMMLTLAPSQALSLARNHLLTAECRSPSTVQRSLQSVLSSIVLCRVADCSKESDVLQRPLEHLDTTQLQTQIATLDDDDVVDNDDIVGGRQHEQSDPQADAFVP